MPVVDNAPSVPKDTHRLTGLKDDLLEAARALRSDLEALRNSSDSARPRWFLALTNRGFAALLLYRFARAFDRSRLNLVSLVLSRVAQRRYAIDISPGADLAPGITIVHGFGLVIGNGAIVDTGVVLFHGVTLGNQLRAALADHRPDGQPHIGSHVTIAVGAKVLGPISIGSESFIGANAVVTNDVPPRSVVAGNPGRVIRTR